ncbi:MAG: zf-TFIIB domain-containing protein [Myxococcota bacterium]
MQLVACSSCHAQYDIAQRGGGEFECLCGATVEAHVPAAVEAEVHRCSSCGALVSSSATGCDYCGSAIVRDSAKLSLICPECFARNADDGRFCGACGVPFQPQPIPSDAPDLDCPACQKRLQARAVAGVPLFECAECSGLWVPENHFDDLVERAAQRHREGGGVGQASRPRVEGANPAAQSVQYRRCPDCNQFMQRSNFRKTSGVIIDRCRLHGTWLDADELERIAGYLLTGGRPRATAFLKAQEAQDEAEYQSARRHKIAAQHSGGFLGEPSTSSGGGALSLLGLLSDLLD